jgi:hypothetical protein
MDLPPWTAEEIAAQAAKLGTELNLEAVTDLLAAVETIEPTLGRPSAPLTAAARRPARSGRCGHLPTRRRAGRAMTDPLSLEAAEVLHAYRAGDTTPVEVLAAVRARIAAVNPVRNSVITVIGDRAAEESTRRWRAGAPRALEALRGQGRDRRGGHTHHRRVKDLRRPDRTTLRRGRARSRGGGRHRRHQGRDHGVRHRRPTQSGIRAGAPLVGHLALDRWILDRFSRGALLPARDRLPCRHCRGVALLARKSSFSEVSDLR